MVLPQLLPLILSKIRVYFLLHTLKMRTDAAVRWQVTRLLPLTAACQHRAAAVPGLGGRDRVRWHKSAQPTDPAPPQKRDETVVVPTCSLTLQPIRKKYHHLLHGR